MSVPAKDSQPLLAMSAQLSEKELLEEELSEEELSEEELSEEELLEEEQSEDKQYDTVLSKREQERIVSILLTNPVYYM